MTMAVADGRAPGVSVAMPAYNAARTIGEALASVAAQTCGDLEVVVVDDGSTDGTAEAARRACPAAKIIRQPNAGPAAARNRAIREARGEWIAFLDADDAWLPWRVSDQMEVAAMFPDAILIGGREADFDASVERIPPSRGICSEVCSSDFVDGSPLWTATVLVRRDAVLRAGGFDEGLRGPEDLDLWMRLAAAGRAIRLDAPVARYRVTPGSLSMDSRRFLPEAEKACAKAFGKGGVLYPYRRLRGRRLATIYTEAAWSDLMAGRRALALRHLLRSWRLWPGRIKVEERTPSWRVALMARILLRRPASNPEGRSGRQDRRGTGRR